MILYGKYVGVVAANHGLVAINSELNNHQKCRIEILEAEVKVTKSQLSEANVMLDGLQGNLEPELATDWAPSCSACVNHRTALVRQRNNSAVNQQRSLDTFKELRTTLDGLIQKYQTVEAANGKLRVLATQTPCPFWKDSAYKSLQDEVKKQAMLVYEANERADDHQRELDQVQIRFKMAQDRLESTETRLSKELYKSECLERGDGKKRKLEEEDELEECTRIDDMLANKLVAVFKITKEHNAEILEKDIYDKFIESTPMIADRERYLEAMYKACHPGQCRMPKNQHKKIFTPNGGQVCKASLAGCLRAIGGVCKKVGSSNVWINVQPRN